MVARIAPGGRDSNKAEHTAARLAQTVYCTKASSSGRPERARKIGVSAMTVAQAKSARSTSASPTFGGPSAPPEARSHAPTSDMKPAPTMIRRGRTPASTPTTKRGKTTQQGDKKAGGGALGVAV